MCKILGFFNSSIGKKILVATAGLLLCGFLIEHLAGNLLLLVGETAFNNYAKELESIPILPLAEIGLAGVFLLHIAASIYGRFQNAAARPVGYAVYSDKGGRTPGSRTMTITAGLVLIFLVVHLKMYRFGDDSQGLYKLVVGSFASPPTVGFYVVAMLALALHLSHGIQSAFQTFGVNHPNYTPLIKKAGILFAVVVGGGFAALPILLYLKGAR